MIEALLTAVVFLVVSLLMGYATRSFWVLLLPVLCSVCFFAIAAAIEPSGDGGAEALVPRLCRGARARRAGDADRDRLGQDRQGQGRAMTV